MAIDTAKKRRNISALHTAITIVGVTPDTLKPVAWRQSVGWGYLGVTPSLPPVEIPSTVYFDAVPFDIRYKTRTRVSDSTGDSFI